MPVIDKDNGLTALVESLTGKEPRLETGIFGDAADAPHGDRGATMGDLCKWMEFGTPTVPARPFISAWWDENGDFASRALQTILKNTPSGAVPWAKALDRLGAIIAADMRAKMPDRPPPQAETTRKKVGVDGDNTTLIDTGALRSAVSHRVVSE